MTRRPRHFIFLVFIDLMYLNFLTFSFLIALYQLPNFLKRYLVTQIELFLVYGLVGPEIIHQNI